MKLLILIGSIVFSVGIAVASGTTIGNGGDYCEDRFKIVRDDISKWITQNGPKGLILPDGLLLENYKTAMSKNIFRAQISCTEDRVIVGGAEKTCKNVLDERGRSQIICNNHRFLETGEADQYVLVHHEYAGLAGFEVTNEANSDYRISNQITGYLENQTVKKLVVKPSSPFIPCSSLDQSKSVAINTKCMTTKGMIFERVFRAYFGRAWKSPDGLIWSENIGNYGWKGAEEACSSLGGSVPYKDAFQRGEASGFREVLPDMIDTYWSASVYSQFEYFYFDGRNDHGRLDHTIPEMQLSVRCVGK